MNSSSSPTTKKRLGIGVDFGTSNSAAAVFDGEQIYLVQLEDDTVVMPSATYIDRELKITTGQSAIDSYIESNMGRTVELSAEVLGEGRTSTGQIGDKGLPEEAQTQLVYGQSLIDGGQQGRLFRGIKRLLGNRSAPRLMVFDRPFRLVALITPLLLRIQQRLVALIKERNLSADSAKHACIGHPVNFEGSDQGRNQLALMLLREAYGYANFEQQSLYPEPIAAALGYLHQNPNASQKTILAVDFGGGTLDLCVLRRTDQVFKVVTTHGVGLGGDHIDQLLFRELLFPLLGKGERWRRAGEDREIETAFPFEDYEELLLNWAISYMLNQNRFTTPLMQRIEYGDEAAVKFRRLYDMIKNNYSYLVFQSLKDLKATLSSESTARLDIPELDIELITTRKQFEKIIAPILSKLQDAVTAILRKANLQSSEIELVIRTGGSSLIPAVKHLLEVQFPGKVIEHDPFTSVATGLAIAEYRGLGADEYTGPESVSKI
ncbi:MAG: Hsp70 family protein [Pseudomonadales bacterium]|nr:Hsp70 family protein [Pseudomonadales bacterium]MBL6816995.1 Hsp70 family protein [Pseudomonadales bacterium]MCH1600560.1 Hsp70 family protein [Pseudomonadales bacterium]